MTDIIIVGGGPSGLTAALYAKRAGKSVLVFEKSVYGGQISKTDEIENYPGLENITGAQFSMSLYSQVKKLGVEFLKRSVEKCEKADAGFIVTAKDVQYEAKTVILALGAYPGKLGLENEERFISKGVSYCAVCDGAFFKDCDVAVVGGGVTAFQDAIYLSDICSKVYLIHRRDSFRAGSNLVEQARSKDNIEFLTNSIVTSLDGEEFLEKIRVKKSETNEEREISLKCLFVATGQIPATDKFSDILPLDEKGYVICGENCSLGEGLFVCGDCRQKDIRQLTTAVADGTTAAVKACEYIG